jgi:GDPmannose 4,6-dehydratase
MWLTLQHPKPDDFVFSTGRQYCVRDFVKEAFGLCGFDIAWKGSGSSEVGFDKNTNRVLVEVDPSFFRPTEVDTLIGNSSKAKNILNWHARTPFKELVHLMVESDLEKSGLDPEKFLKSCRVDH